MYSLCVLQIHIRAKLITMSGHVVDEKVVARAGKIAIVAVIVLAFALYPEAQKMFGGNTGESNQELKQEQTQTYYEVTKVVDGDTLHVAINGVDEKVRLIGINTPETVDPRRPVQCFGKEASVRMKELAQGKLVRLESDPTQDTRDVYGRILSYVYLEDGEMLNRKMIAEGYAYEYTYLIPYTYQKEFKGLQNLARTSEYGLWSKATCNGIK